MVKDKVFTNSSFLRRHPEMLGCGNPEDVLGKARQSLGAAGRGEVDEQLATLLIRSHSSSSRCRSLRRGRFTASL